MKRFYKTAQYAQEAEHYIIKLDDREITTPAKNSLISPSEALAKEICLEWNAQEENIIPASMPVTQYCYTALDYIPKHRTAIINTILNFLDTDLVCYHAEKPDELVIRQSEAWDLFLDWFESKFSAKLETTTGLAAIKQSDAAHAAVTKYVNAMNDEQLTIAQCLTAACGSLVMALCFLDGQANSEQMFAASFVEELYQGAVHEEERYGVDPTQEKQRRILKQDLDAARIYLDCLEDK